MNAFQMPIPKDVRDILQALEQAGHFAYIVGGAVRDAVMGKLPHDYDICTSALPLQMQEIFHNRPVIETGLQHGTLTVVGEENHYEVTTYRVDGNYGDNRHPESVTFVDHIEEDLSRRDFTINAMAYNEQQGLIDPFGGAQDIEKKCIRCVGDPEKRFAEDALRILRGIRFSSVCGFSVEKATESAMFLQKDRLKPISEERKTIEFSKLLIFASAELLLRYREIFAVFIPEIKPCFGFDQRNFHHKYDVYEHIAHAVAEAPHELIIRLALFFHDIGKPAVFSCDENGVGHFYDHAKISRNLTENALKRMKFDNKTLFSVKELVEAHGLVPYDSLKFARRLLNRFGEDQTKRLLMVSRCDILAQAEYDGRDLTLQTLACLQQHIETVIAEKQCISIKHLAVNGHDIQNLGVREGKQVGEILSFLLDAVLEQSENNEKEILLQIARKYIKEKSIL